MGRSRLASRSVYAALLLAVSITAPAGTRSILMAADATWQALNLPGSVTTVVTHPSDGSIVYATRSTGDGIHNSADGGATWNPSNNGLVAASNGRLYVPSLAIHKQNPSLLLAAVGGSGVHRSTDAGASWTRVIPNYDGFVVAFGRVNTSLAYAGSNGEGFHRSFDNGQTWQLVGPSLGYCGLYVWDIAVDPTTAGHAYAQVSDTRLTSVTTSVFIEVQNAGADCVLASFPGLPSGAVVSRVRFSPAGDLYVGTQAHGVFVQRTGQAALALLDASIPGPITTFAFEPGISTRAYVGTATSGVYACDVICAAFSQGLGDLRVRALTLAGSPARFYAGTQNGLFGRGVDLVNPYPTCAVLSLLESSNPPNIVAGELTANDCETSHRPGHTADIYSFQANAGDSANFAVFGGIGSSTFDSYLILAGPDGHVIAENDNARTTQCLFGGGFLDACLTVDLPVTGTYFIEVTSATPIAFETYSLHHLVRAPLPPSNAVDLAVSMTASPELVTNGATIDYSIVVRNNGSLTATGVQIVDPLPSGLVFLSSGSDPRCRGAAIVTCQLGSLPASSSAALTLRLRTQTAGRLTNSVNVNGAQADDQVSNNSASTTTVVLPQRIEGTAVNQLDGLLLPSRPTIVLTHGWSETDALPGAPNSLWIGNGAHQASGLIATALHASNQSANIARFVWRNAFTQTSSLNRLEHSLIALDEYLDARIYVEAAGVDLGQRLLEVLTPDYDQEIQFIGHSLGTAVNAHAALYFLSRAPNVPRVRFTVLDRPDRISLVLGSNSVDSLAGFGRDYFVTLFDTIPSLRASPKLDLVIENYYSLTGLSFGDSALGSVRVPAYNHPPLERPSRLSSVFFPEEEDSTDHSGVAQWYRLTVNPEIDGTAHCDASAWTFGGGPPPRWLSASLNPCQNGWYRSLFGPADGSFPGRLDTTHSPSLSTSLITGTAGRPVRGRDAWSFTRPLGVPIAFEAFENFTGCAVHSTPDGSVIGCSENPESLAMATVNIPTDSAYLSFRYRFGATADGEHAVVFLDGRPVWLLPGNLGAGDAFQTATGLPIRGLSGTRTLTVAFYGAGAASGHFEMGQLEVTAGAPIRRYLSEGATGSFFDTRVALLNPNSEATAAALRFLKADGTSENVTLPVAGMSRATVDPESVSGMDDTAFSTVIESGLPLVVDRLMRWDASGYGSHAETSLSSPSRTWYLAEGATHSGFSLFYLIQNPDTVPIDVAVSFLRPAPAAPIVKTYTVAPRSRFNIWVNQADPELASTDVSATFIATDPIIVERAMYLDRPGQQFAAGHESAAIGTPSSSWFLAEGATGDYFDTFVLIANPTAEAAQVEVAYLLSGGINYSKSYVVAPMSRFNIWVDEEELPGLGKALANVAVSMTVSSTNDVPLIVERAMWWPGPTSATWAEAHNSPGAVTTGLAWGLAEGEVGGPQEADTYILIANTSAVPGNASVQILFEDATRVERLFSLLPNSRTNIHVLSEFPEASGRRFGAIVESLGETPAQIVVERAMYSDSVGIHWAAGTNALATKLR